MVPRAATAETLQAARSAMSGRATTTTCGPYPVLTDRDDLSVISRLCQSLDGLDEAYRRTLSIRPIEQPTETLILFSQRSDYRRFAAEHSRLTAGYAGHADAARGYLAMPLEAEPHDLRATLAHEIAHLLHRRALGPNLPPWLSEGMADLFGDSAVNGDLWSPIESARDGDELTRLRWGYGQRLVPSVERLVELDRTSFDRQQPSFDYEQSASLVRLLLTDPQLDPGFRQYLRALAKRGPYRSEDLRAELAVEWSDIDRRLERSVLVP